MLPIDENHATDKGGAKGMPAPARGWIVALQARASGLWGKVQWTGERRKLVEDKAYIGISPVILHTAAGKIIQVLRASLTNTPNLQGLTSLHSYAAPTALASKLPHVLDTAYRRIMQLLGQSEGQYLRGLPDR